MMSGDIHILSFTPGEQVRLCTGPFSGRVGQVEAVSLDKRLLRVKVETFGHATQIEVFFLDVEKLTFSEDE
jgi:transcriptional antiterminator NusG